MHTVLNHNGGHAAIRRDEAEEFHHAHRIDEISEAGVCRGATAVANSEVTSDLIEPVKQIGRDVCERSGHGPSGLRVCERKNAVDHQPAYFPSGDWVILKRAR